MSADASFILQELLLRLREVAEQGSAATPMGTP